MCDVGIKEGEKEWLGVVRGLYVILLLGRNLDYTLYIIAALF